MREGKDVTLIAFGKLVGYNLKAAEILEKEGISAEACADVQTYSRLRAVAATTTKAHVHTDHAVQVINLRTLKPIDRDTIVASVKKTHRVVSAEEGWPQSGVGSEIIAIISEEAFVSSRTALQ